MYYRILCIDGGGIKGVFPASFLSSIEENINDSVGNYFDLICGTSTGGIIALAIGLQHRCSKILSFYNDLGPKIFKKRKIFSFLSKYAVSKYNARPLKDALSSFFGNSCIGESKNRLVIPSLNLETGEVHVYKTRHHQRFEFDYKQKAIDVAMATSAAPSYFPTVRNNGVPLIDGGLWANNPAIYAAIEGIGILNWPRDKIRILSIGCTAEPLSINAARHNAKGEFYWAKKIKDLFMNGNSSASLGASKLLVGHDNVLRIDPVLPNGRFRMDSIEEMESLKGLGYSEARKATEKIKEMFLYSSADKFIAC